MKSYLFLLLLPLMALSLWSSPFCDNGVVNAARFHPAARILEVFPSRFRPLQTLLERFPGGQLWVGYRQSNHSGRGVRSQVCLHLA
jgi:hypothetical protein